MPRFIEVCSNSLESALAAQAGGASRIELCTELGLGGVTPSYGMLSLVRERVNLTMNVLIRPRSGSFVYTAEEAEMVLRDICMCADIGADGVVIGALDENGHVDLRLCRNWTDYAHKLGLTVTFHRAIDSSADIFASLEEIISLGCDRILTSGGKPSAFEGRETIREMVSRSAGRIIIMPGAGINPGNIARLEEYTQAAEFHASANGGKDCAELTRCPQVLL